MAYNNKHLRKYKYWIAFIDGEKRTRYSFESNEKKGIALREIRKLAMQKYKGKYKSFIIYDNLTGAEIERYSNGLRVEKAVSR